MRNALHKVIESAKIIRLVNIHTLTINLDSNIEDDRSLCFHICLHILCKVYEAAFFQVFLHAPYDARWPNLPNVIDFFRLVHIP